MVIGADIGGTHVRAALIENGRILKVHRVNPQSSYQTSQVLLSICKELRKVAREYGGEAEAIGVGVAGKIDPREGKIIFSPNLPHLNGFPFGKAIQTELKLPVAIDNDANVFGLGESCFGKGRGLRNWIGITLGTGVGGCLILNNSLWQGDNLGFVGEIGHTIVIPDGPRCACGLNGCLESLASGGALVRRARNELENGRLTEGPLYECVVKGQFNAQDVYRCARMGDDVALRLFFDMGWALGIALANIFTVLGINHAIIGGGVSASWDLFSGPLRASIESHTSMLTSDMIHVYRSELGDKAALLGAAKLAEELLTNRR